MAERSDPEICLKVKLQMIKTGENRSEVKRAVNLFARQEGMALVLVLVFCTALMALGAAVITYAVLERKIAVYNSSDIRLYYIVEGGLETGIAVLQEDFYYDGELNGTIGGGSYTVLFSDEYQHYSPDRVDEAGEEYFENHDQVRFVRCLGFLGNHSKTMSIAVSLNEQGRVQVIRWYRPFPSH